MIERAQTVADVVAAFGGIRSGTGWHFARPSDGYRIDRTPIGDWVVGYVDRNEYRADRTFTIEREAARYLFAMLQGDG